MLAKELTKGMECYYHLSSTWKRSPWPGNRAVIVDAGPARWKMDKDGHWIRSDIPGQEILVDIYGPHAGNPAGYETPPVRRTAVRPQTLRGPWRETYDQHAERVAQLKKTEDAEWAARKSQRIYCQQAVDVLRQLGIVAEIDYTRIAIPNASLALLMAAAQHLIDTGWTPPTDTERTAT